MDEKDINYSIQDIIEITTKDELLKIIISGQFDNPVQIKNIEHICNDGSIYDYSEITDMSNMFLYQNSLQSVPLFDTSNVTNMHGMFYGCDSLIDIPLFDTSNVTDMSFMFKSCHSLVTVPLFDTSNVTTMKSMFSYCSSLTSIPLLNISNVSNLDLIFTASYFLTKIDKVRFFYQQDKLLLKALSNNLDFFTTDKLNNLLSKYEQSFIFT